LGRNHVRPTAYLPEGMGGGRPPGDSAGA
jgi:hypothetical protein